MRTQNQVKIETKNRINQIDISNDNDELEIKSYRTEKKPVLGKNRANLPEYPRCTLNVLIDFDRRSYCSNCDFNNKNQKSLLEKKVNGIDKNFSKTLYYANKINENFFSMMNTKSKTTEDMIRISQQLTGKTKS